MTQFSIITASMINHILTPVIVCFVYHNMSKQLDEVVISGTTG